MTRLCLDLEIADDKWIIDFSPRALWCDLWTSKMTTHHCRNLTWNSGGRQLRISLYKLRISEIFISSNSVKSFASSRVRTADLESHSPPLYHRAKLDCCEKKLLFSIYKLSLNSRRSRRFFFDSWFPSWHLSDFEVLWMQNQSRWEVWTRQTNVLFDREHKMALRVPRSR